MRIRISRFIICLIIAAIALNLSGCDRFVTKGDRVERVSDGDTIRVIDQSGNRVTVRLACIDAPEIPHSQKERDRRNSSDKNQFQWGAKAQARLEELIKQGGDRVILTTTDNDKYGRKVAEVRLPNGTFVQQVLLQEGLAKVYRPYLKTCPSRDILETSEAKAKQAKTGVWGDSKFVNPWEWRFLNKQK